jgi:hypothetical protein
MPINTFVSTDLFPNLTREERLRVQVFAADRTIDLPRFFNAGTQQIGDVPDETISREFEAFLILQTLQSPEKLTEAMKWFNEAADLQLSRQDRDNLLAEAYLLEKSDAVAKAHELNDRTLRFAQFRATFQQVDPGPEVNAEEFPPARFSQVPEISLIMRDSQAAMGQIASDQKRTEYRVVMNEVLDKDRISRVRTEDAISGIADDKIAEELLSWRNVISDIQARVTGATG